MRPETLLFALLRAAVCGDEVGEELICACTADTLKQVYLLAQRHDLAHLVGYALSGASLPDCEERRQLKQAEALAVFRHTRLDNELKQICAVLERAGVAHLPLKGAVIRELYPAPWMRTSGDIDIMVREEELEKAVAALSDSLSYSTDGEKNYHDVLLIAPSGVHVELHFSIRENEERMDVLLRQVWNYALPVTGYRYALTNEFLAFHLIAHMAYHFAGGGCGIRPFLDVFLLKRHTAYDETVLRTYLSRCGLERFYDHVWMLIGVWFENRPPTSITENMEAFVLNGGTYGSQNQRLAVARERKGGKLRYVISRIFMPYGRLKMKYPILERCPLLTPVMQIRRWFGVLSGGRLKRAANEVRRCGQIEKEQADAVGVLLRQLGL